MTTDIDILASRTLINAADLVLRGHYKGSYAADAEGRQVMPHNKNAVCFCAVGAIYRAAFKIDPIDPVYPVKLRAKVQAAALDRLRDALVTLDLGSSIPGWNDRPGTTPANVAGALVFASLGDEP